MKFKSSSSRILNYRQVVKTLKKQQDDSFYANIQGETVELFYNRSHNCVYRRVWREVDSYSKPTGLEKMVRNWTTIPF